MKPTNGSVLRLEVRGYVPLTRNQLKGTHWSVLHKEKTRACLHLLESLRIESVRESVSECSALAHAIGTTTASRKFRTAFSRLDSWIRMTGTNYREASSLKRFTQKRKKEPSSK